ncbi:MAG: response regulator transcription factor [Cyanobacteria bacterium P01_H01_bin.121]
MTSTLSPSILVVEPDPALAHTINLDLQEAGYNAVIVHDFRSGLQQVERLQPSMTLIDRLLSHDSGIQLCQQLRQNGYYKPVLLMMIRDALEDRIACLEAGADDYLLKPYRAEQFLQRIKFYLQPNVQTGEQLRFANLVLDLGGRRVYRNNEAIELTMKEFELLKYLMEHPREVLTREQILENVWGYDFMGESNVIEVYIRYLRLKIEADGDKRLIQTVRGVGYVLREA